MSKPIHRMVEVHAIRTPDANAFVDSDGQVYSYAQFQAAIDEAVQFLGEYELKAGDRIVLVSENCLATAVFIFAASRVGAYIIPINARMSPVELRRIVEHSTPRITLYTSDVSKEASLHATTAKAKMRESGFGNFAVATFASSEPAPDDSQGTAVILYTTGTTGDPKGVMLSHANLNFAAQASAQSRGLEPSDRIYGVLPLTHVYGLASMLMASCYVGASVQLETRFQAKRVYAALTNEVTIFPAVPQMHALVMQYANEQGFSRLHNSQLRYVSSGAAPLDPSWKRKAEAFYGLALQNGYGMTECTAGICNTRNSIGTTDTSVGTALPGTEIRIDTNIGAADEGVGEIMTRGPNIMKGYFNNPAATAEVIDADGWLRTGDLGKIDTQGNLHVVGRCKELIIRGGFNVYPPEVETALNDHPDVILSAVIGRKLENGDEEILAFVQCRDPAALDTALLANFVSDRLTNYKRPSRIITSTELPAAATGKVLKHQLLSAFANQLFELDI